MDTATGQNGGGPASTEDDGRNCPDCGRVHRPLAGYSLLTAGFLTSFAGGLALAHRRRGSLRAEIRPQDLVGAIAGESRLSGRQIGAIDIADRFSLVDVPDDAADEVIAALRASTIKGKKATIRRERDSST